MDPLALTPSASSCTTQHSDSSKTTTPTHFCPHAQSSPSSLSQHPQLKKPKIHVDPARLATITPLERRLSLSELVQTITALLSPLTDDSKSASAVDYYAIYQSLLSYDHSLNEWKRFALADSSRTYTRNLIATDDQTFSLMLLVWNPASTSSIHDHQESECFMMTIAGEVVETQYHMPDSPQFCSSDAILNAQHSPFTLKPITPTQSPTAMPLTTLKRSTSAPGSINFIDNSIGLHSVGNPSKDTVAVTLHLYIPPYESSLMFDSQSGSCSEGFVSFYSEQGQVVGEEF